MATAVHPSASHHLPGFITAPGETDILMVISLVMLLAIVVGIGVFYFKLHALPEQIAHSGEKVQFQIVAVLSLLALFTHNHVYWIAALLLAFVPIPDFLTPVREMASSIGKLAEAKAPATRKKTAAPVKRAPSKVAAKPDATEDGSDA